MDRYSSLSNKEFELIRAISNNKRLELLNYIYKNPFSIKSDLITEFNFQRAGLDFHLSSLEEAGLIGTMIVKINNRKHVFVFPRAVWKINVNPLETEHLDRIIPSEISIETIESLMETIWFDESLKNPQIIRSILLSLISKLEMGLNTIMCNLCRSEVAILRCFECRHFICQECSDIINKREGERIILCDRCIADQFS